MDAPLNDTILRYEGNNEGLFRIGLIRDLFVSFVDSLMG